MSANKDKARAYFVFKRGEDDPVFEIHLNCEDDVTRDIFARYYDYSKNILIAKIRMPRKPKTKKMNENENEYDEKENPKVIYKAVPTATAQLKSWKWLKYFYETHWTKIASYHGKFKVEVFDLGRLGKLFLVYNIFDDNVQLFTLVR